MFIKNLHVCETDVPNNSLVRFICIASNNNDDYGDL